MDLVSIIVPLFNEEANVIPLVARIREALDHAQPYEIILVDDGSRDGTFATIRREAATDNRVRGLRFRRNCGQTSAIRAGIEHASGTLCVTMDGDLQHDPAQIPAFLDKIKEGYDLVCSYRHGRNDAWHRRFPSQAANFLARRFSGLQVKDFGSTFRAYRTSLAREIEIHGEMHRFVPVFGSMITDRITEIPITLQPREHGTSKYGLDRTFRVFSDLLLLLFFAGFFNRPIHIFGYIALSLGLPGFTILSWLSIERLLGRIAIMDYGPLFVLGILLCLVAAQLFTTGIVCEYLVRIYYRTGAKPYSLAETTFQDETA
jgi:glycosyltransferase involved in cell wall biosynthesis